MGTGMALAAEEAAGGAPVTGEPAVAPLAGAGPEAIGTLPGSEEIGPTTFSETSAEGRVILQVVYSSWILKSGQSSIWPEGLVHVFTASWRNTGSQPIMKSPW